MRAYPDSIEQSKRKARKTLRKQIFWENSQEGNRIRRERKLAKKEGK